MIKSTDMEKVNKVNKVKGDKERDLLLANLCEAEARVADLRNAFNKKINDAIEAIRKIESEGNFFCGVVLKKSDLLKAMELMLETGKDVKIPFQVYDNN